MFLPSSRERRPNCPHKRTKTAEPWLGGGAAVGGSELHARGTPSAVRSRHCGLVAAGAGPLPEGRGGGGLLQLRVITLGRWRELRTSLKHEPHDLRAIMTQLHCRRSCTTRD